MKKTRLLVGECKKCGETIKIGLGEGTKEDAIKAISKWETFQCPGNHVELSSPYPHYWPLDEFKVEEGETYESEEEFEAKLRETYTEVRDTEGMQGLIESFAMGYPITNDGKAWSFVHSPKGKRWYYTND